MMRVAGRGQRVVPSSLLSLTHAPHALSPRPFLSRLCAEWETAKGPREEDDGDVMEWLLATIRKPIARSG